MTENLVVLRVARRLYENTPPYGPSQTDWDCLPPERKTGWISDAQIAVAIVAEEAARLADMREEDKPSTYRFSRNDIAPVMRGIPNDPPNRY